MTDVGFEILARQSFYLLSKFHSLLMWDMVGKQDTVNYETDSYTVTDDMLL